MDSLLYFLCVLVLSITLTERSVVYSQSALWTWKCREHRCEKSLTKSGEKSQSLTACNILCDKYASIWPKPTGKFVHSNKLVPINHMKVSLKYEFNSPGINKVHTLMEEAGLLFKAKVGARVNNMTNILAANPLSVRLNISNTGIYAYKMTTSERYQLEVSYKYSINQVEVIIIAETFFGARHGLETLNQLIVFDDQSRNLMMPNYVRLHDSPFYPYRGILLDTSRSFFSVSSIKRTLDAMAFNKLNTFHWHIVDSHSFPFQSKKYPQFTRYGAYFPKQVYTHEDIRSIVEYGRVRGIRIVPEFDQPAHVGEGWQWIPGAVLCFKIENRKHYCTEPPCGFLDPTNKEVYEILFHLYKELLQLFDSDLFHMGGDEVKFTCWNSTESIRSWLTKNGLGHNTKSFMHLRKVFQDTTYKKFIEAGGKDRLLVLWTSQMTSKGHVHKILDNEKYIIQFWERHNNKQLVELVKRGFRIIFSNHDALYLDCGSSSWLGAGNNWCSPYKVWQKIYSNDPLNLMKGQGLDITDIDIMKQALGAEVTLWTEQVDEYNLDSRLWPRASALAERLWSRPEDGPEAAEARLLEHRKRLLQMGVRAAQVQPEWCRMNGGHCSFPY